MNHTTLKLVAVALCTFVAFLIPGKIHATHEVGILHSSPVRLVQAISEPNHPGVEALTALETPKPPEAPKAVTYSTTEDEALNWIIAHESGGNPHAMNPSGACGLGQSLPCSKVLSVCGSLDNVPCQVQWVRDYCISRYGSTIAAMQFWQAHNWY